jgi:hypothetical protein
MKKRPPLIRCAKDHPNTSAVFSHSLLYLVKLRLQLLPVFRLGGSCAFLVFFFGEVSDKGKPLPPPSSCLAGKLAQ